MTCYKIMNPQRLIIYSFTAITITGSIANAKDYGTEVLDKVDVFIGTGAHCHNFPSAMVPFGAVVAGPDCATIGWDAAAGYHYDATSILGFSQQHLSGTGLTELGDLLIMPVNDTVNFNPGSAEDPDSGYRSRFSHDKESASPGYYQVYLSDYNINAEMTATERTGFYRFSYNSDSKYRNIIFDLVHHINGSGSRVQHAYYKMDDAYTVSGYRMTNAVWAPDRHLYFSMRFSEPIVSSLTLDEEKKMEYENLSETGGKRIKAAFRFRNTGKPLLVKISISSVSMQNARENMQTENPGWDFDAIQTEAEKKWAAEIGKVEAEGTKANVRKFYAALYHNMIHPSLLNDVNGQYRGISKEVKDAGDNNIYHMFSLWDTYRATHPLFTIIHQNRTKDIVRSMLAFQQENPAGMLPMWSMYQNENSCMIGLHAIPVIADAYAKGLLDGIDEKQILDAMVTSSEATGVENTSNSRIYPSYYNQAIYLEKGYHPIDLVRSGTSVTLEHSFDDWSVAFMADKIGENEVSSEFLKRSNSFKNLWDSSTGFFRAKTAAGDFLEPFDPRSYHREGFHDRDYIEGNAWQYLFAVQHNIYGLRDMLGGEKAFRDKLTEMFSLPYEGESPIGDVSGLIGDYAHGNEPCHHVAYLFNYAGAPYRTQELIHEIDRKFYKDAPDGYIGNEDAGQMSAWYVFSAMGFYPVNPVGGIYVIGSPLLESVSIRMDNGNTFRMKARNLSEQNIYVQSVKVNGKPYNNVWISHEIIAEGGTIEFEMGPRPGKWGKKTEPVPFGSGEVALK